MILDISVTDCGWLILLHFVTIKWLLSISQRHFALVKTSITLCCCEIITVLLHSIGVSGFWFCNLTFSVWLIGLHLVYHQFTFKGVPKRIRVPDIVFNSGTSCLLQWSSPHDGGSLIKGYSLEICRKNGFDWCQVTSAEITKNQYTVENLLRGHEYKFRVMAHNEYGLGPAGVETDLVLFIDPPGPPRDIEVSDVTQSSCLVSWLPPEDDGGAPIRTYHLEMCSIQGDFGGDWDFCALVEGDKHIHRATGLTDGFQYLFRLTAVNQSGSSFPVQTYDPVTAFGTDVYDGTIVSHSLDHLQALSRDKASILFVRGVDELNRLMVLILSLQPERTSRESVRNISKDFKALTSRALFFFQDALKTLDVVQEEIDKRLVGLIVNQKETEDELNKMKSKLVGMKNQLKEQKERVEEAKQHLEKVKDDQRKAKETLDETVRQLERKKTEQTATKVGGSLGIVGGAAAVAGAGIGVVLTGGLAAPLLIPAAGVAVAGGAAAAGGIGAVVAGCTVLEKNKQAAENAVQLASEELDAKQKTIKRQEKELERCEQNVQQEETRIRDAERKLRQLLIDISDLKSKQKEHQGVFERLRECVSYLTSTAGKAEVLDDVMKYLHELKSVVPVIADVASHLNQRQVLQLKIFSQVDQQVLLYNVEALMLHEDTPDGQELVLAQKMLVENELLGTQVTQWESFVLGLPRLVMELGKTVVTSNAIDFPLNDTGRTFKFLKNPQSFRACLHQVCSDSWNMLNNLHGNMEKIRLLTQQISIHSASAANVVTGGENAEVVQFLPGNLEPLKYIAEKSCKLCKDTEIELDTWMSMMSELLEASLEKHSLSESHRKEAREAYSIVLSELEAASQEKSRLQQELDDFQRSLDTSSYENSKNLTGLPNGFGLAVIFNANLVTNALALRFGMFSNSCDQIWKKIEKKRKEDADVPVAKRQDDDQLPELLKEAEMSLSALDDVKQNIMPRGYIERHLLQNPGNVLGPKVRTEVFYKKVMKMKSLRYQITLEKILKATVAFFGNLYKLAKSMEIYLEDAMDCQARLLKHHKALSDFVELVTQQLGVDATIRKINHDKKKETMKVNREKSEKTVVVNVAQHHVNQEMMKMTESYFKLQEAKKLYDAKSWDVHKVNNRIKSDMLELAEVDGSCASLHETVVSLSEAVQGLNFIKQQWTGFSQMFQFVGNRMEHSLSTGVEHFAQIARTEVNRIEKGRSVSQYARELLWQEASEACALAQCLHLVADEYVTASSQHLLTPVNQLGRLVFLSSDTPRVEHLKMLQRQCVESQNSLQEQMESSHKRKMAAFNSAIEGVMDNMKRLAPPTDKPHDIDIEAFA